MVLRLPQEIQTLYAELSERVSAYDAARSFSSLKGGFVTKHVAGADYWYFKTSATLSGQREYAIGRDTPATRAIIDAYQNNRSAAEEVEQGITRLCAMLRQGGALTADTASAKIISGLGSAGVFRLGGVLVGTHAFAALGNTLGVRWQSGLATQDIDILASPVLEVAIGNMETDLPAALDSLNMGFIPVPGLDPRRPETSFSVRGKTLRVDLLTPARGKRDGKPVHIPRLKAYAQPLEFLDYLLDAPIDIPVINGGATLVKTPDPARFALHKLLVSTNRPVTLQTKSAKDRQQAAEVLEVLLQDRPGDIELAMENLLSRGLGWRKRIKEGAARLPDSHAAVKRHLLSLIG